MDNRIYGVVIGTVKSLDDPDSLGRIQLTFPWMSDDNESPWARVAVQMAGEGRGMWYMPELEDEVLVAFEHGDPQHPYVIGFLWNGKDKPPTTNTRRRLIHSLNGHEIEIYDPDPKDGDKGFIRIKDAHGNKIELSNATLTIEGVGNLQINAPNITINKRLVAPIPGKPI
ncbi:MAG TPA: phage baseplate assembly protein V [Candidatus Kapabacteria bacterium]|nr:phage baseplate assembly protein V [Candidatus Kapabacteria bacterium]